MTATQAHLRVDIAGGTLDLWPLYNFISGAKTINCAISLKTQCHFEIIKNSSKIHVEVVNFNFSKTYQDLNQLLSSQEKELRLIQTVFENYNLNTGFKVKIMSESPVGGGLGGSSTLMIALLQAVDQELRIERQEESFVDFAANLESQILGAPAGTQDYYQALHPGLSVISYEAGFRKREFFKSPWLERNKKNFVLIYSGIQHHSGLNNWTIFQKCVEKDSKVLSVMRGLKENSESILKELLKPVGSFKDSIRDSTEEFLSKDSPHDTSKNLTSYSTDSLKNPQMENLSDFDFSEGDLRMSELLSEELHLRRSLATGFVNKSLESIITDLSKKEVHHIKICGAGGGGCLWAIVPPHQKQSILEMTHSHPSLEILDCQLIL